MSEIRLTTNNYRLIPADKLHPNPDNPRKEAGDVSDLARSIAEVGQLHPALVRERDYCREHYKHLMPGQPQCYWIEAGYRRWVALSSLGMNVECQVRKPAPDESERERNLVIGLIENFHRSGLNAMEIAEGLGKLRDEEHKTQDQIARITGIHSTSVNRYLALLELAPKTREAVRTVSLGTTDALRLVRQYREDQRKKGGKKSLSIEWEPDHFTSRHSLARLARTMCDARGHTQRRRVGGVACGQCWETAIRQDEDTVVKARYEAAGYNAPVMSAWPVDHPMQKGSD